VICVFAAPGDPRATAFIRSCDTTDVRLLTPADLSAPGWQFDLTCPERGQAVIGGEPVLISQLTGVLTLLPAVFPQLLTRIVPAERDYAAAEMTAFLRCWLESLPCPVLNRPAAASLCGPWWRPERWAAAARSLGIPAEEFTRQSQDGARRVEPGPQDEVNVTVIGSRPLQAPNATIADHAVRLAQLVRAEVLTVRFHRGADGVHRVVGALPGPQEVTAELVQAILGRMVAQP
jgi:hypothetical protein